MCGWRGGVVVPCYITENHILLIFFLSLCLWGRGLEGVRGGGAREEGLGGGGGVGVYLLIVQIWKILNSTWPKEK